MTAMDLSAASLAPALRAVVSEEASGSVTDEVIAASGTDGELLPFAFAPDHSQSITVKDDMDSPLTEGTDYNLTANGIVVIGTGAIDNAGHCTRQFSRSLLPPVLKQQFRNCLNFF